MTCSLSTYEDVLLPVVPNNRCAIYSVQTHLTSAREVHATTHAALRNVYLRSPECFTGCGRRRSTSLAYAN